MVKGVLTSLYTRPGYCVPISVRAGPRSGSSGAGFALKDGGKNLDRLLYLGVITVTSTYTLVSIALLILVFMR